MAWEQRGSNYYYYRKERDGARVRSVYVGVGATAELIAQFDGTFREEEIQKQKIASCKLARMEIEDESIEATCSLINEAVQVTLLALGFHTHNRQWRKQRYERTNDFVPKR